MSIFPGKGLEFYAHLSGTPLSGADGGLAAPFVFDSRDALQVCLLRGFSSGEAEDGITLIEAGEIFTGKLRIPPRALGLMPAAKAPADVLVIEKAERPAVD